MRTSSKCNLRTSRRDGRSLIFAFLFLLGAGLAPLVAASSVAAANAPKLSMHAKPRPMPALVFADGDGRTVRLKDFRGKVVVLNLWATWCAPCRKEMPTLDRLQAKLGGADFEVVALSVDFTGLDVVRRFYRDFGIRNLRPYIDPSSRVLEPLNVLGLPATLLIDRKGREIGRLVGPAEWDSPEMLSLFRRLIDRDRDDRTVNATPPARIAQKP